MQKSHETALRDKTELINTLQAVLTEQEERIKELEDGMGKGLKI